MSIFAAIQSAESILPGSAAPDGALDPRWQAVIAVGEYVDSDPDLVWEFSRKWAEKGDEDLRMAVATCLLEHLLEEHFDRLFPKMEDAVRESTRFADCFSHCWAIGQAEEDGNRERFESLKELATGAR